MKDNEIEELARFTTLADEIMGIEKWAEKRPDSITAYFLQKARTTLWNTPTERHSRSRQVITDEAQALLNGVAIAVEVDGEEPPKKRGRPSKGPVSKSGADFRRIPDWKVELLIWGVSHGGVLDLDQYREQKLLKDYPDIRSTSQTRYSQGVNELKRQKLINSAGRRRYTVNAAGERFLADKMNTPATNTPTPPPQPPPPMDYVPDRSEDIEEETPVVNQGLTRQEKAGQTRSRRKRMLPVAERLVNFAKKHNGIFHPAEYRKEEVRAGHSIPGGTMMNHLKNPRLFKKVSAGEYHLVVHG